jgi:hypothetical protein
LKQTFITENEKFVAFSTGLDAMLYALKENIQDYGLYNREAHACNILPFNNMAPVGVVS